jgi:ribosome-associated protein
MISDTLRLFAIKGSDEMQATEFELQGEFIPLDALLKTTGLASSGGTAKAMVAAGQVQVDGELELRKRCKIRAGQVVSVGGAIIRVNAAGG